MRLEGVGLDPEEPLESMAPPCDSLSSARPASCSNDGHQVRRILVTGMGGSGTHSVTKLLWLNKIVVQHEDVEKDGAVAWPYAVDARTEEGHLYDNATWRQANRRFQWFASHPPTLFENIFHVVRCPIDVMSSETWWPKHVFDFMRKHVRLDSQWDEACEKNVRLYAETWLRWNEHIEQYARSRHQIGSLMGMFQQIVSLSGHNASASLIKLPNTVRMNSKRKRTFTWAELQQADSALADAVRAKAIEYGFTEECTEDKSAGGQAPVLARDRITLAGPTDPRCRPGVICEDEDGIAWMWSEVASQNLTTESGLLRKSFVKARDRRQRS